MNRKTIPTLQTKKVDRWVSWVNEHRPLVALLGETEVRRIVIRAIDDSSAVRFWLMICVVLAGAFAGYHFSTLSADPSFDRWKGALAIGGLTGLLSFATERYTHTLIVRKIESLASGDRHM